MRAAAGTEACAGAGPSSPKEASRPGAVPSAFQPPAASAESFEYTAATCSYKLASSFCRALQNNAAAGLFVRMPARATVSLSVVV